MPTYEYECKSCGHTFNVFQSMSDDPVKICPECGESVRRLISGGSGIIFKGQGFYITDKNKGNTASPKTSTKPANGAAASEKGETGSSASEKPGSSGAGSAGSEKSGTGSAAAEKSGASANAGSARAAGGTSSAKSQGDKSA
jgi:putative FmdB family regulatory protein